MDAILSQFLDAVVEDPQVRFWARMTRNLFRDIIITSPPPLLQIIGYHKSLVSIRLGEVDKKLIDGADEYLQVGRPRRSLPDCMVVVTED